MRRLTVALLACLACLGFGVQGAAAAAAAPTATAAATITATTTPNATASTTGQRVVVVIAFLAAVNPVHRTAVRPSAIQARRR